MQPEIRRTLVGLSRLDIDNSAGSKSMKIVWPVEDRCFAPCGRFAEDIFENRQLVASARGLKSKDIVFGEEPKDDAAGLRKFMSVDN